MRIIFPPRFRRSALLANAAPMLLLAACVAPSPSRAPPPPIPVPVPAPRAPVTTDWRDIPLTAGDWRYGVDPGGSAARFGRAGAQPDFIARCDRGTRIVSLARSAAVPAVAATMTITTSAGGRSLPVAAIAGPPPALAALLPARDGYLDRMAFSRGRFVVAVSGTALLVLPSWPEFARVIEDCRAPAGS